jgi:hypothetical protein
MLYPLRRTPSRYDRVLNKRIRLRCWKFHHFLIYMIIRDNVLYTRAQIICNQPTHSCRGLHALPLHQRHTPQRLCSKA